MKRYIIVIFFGVMLCITSSCANRQSKTEQESIKEEKSLVALGQLWGFLKYHHPAVANGDYDWDMELIKRIPLVRETENDSIWKKILDDWLDSLPPVKENPDKKLPDLEIKVKPDYGELFNDEYFFPETIEKIRYILNNAVITTNYYVNVKGGGNLSFTNESSYEYLLYPDLSYRLLALFRFWNMVNYFFPYRELCDQKWKEVLVEMLPVFINAEDREKYTLACLKLLAKIDDSHGIIDPNIFESALKVPFETQFIEGKLVVTMFTGNDAFVKEKIETGDVITAIDGEPVDDIVKRMWSYTPASNEAVKLREITSKILRGNTNSVSITIMRDEKSFEINIPRYSIHLLNIPDYFRNPHPGKEGYMVLDNNIGYILPSNCKKAEKEAGIKKVLDGTKGVIIDMRCYPSDYISFPFIYYLQETQTRVFSKQSSYANVSYPGYFVSKRFRETMVPKYRYTPNIVVIVNEYTQCQAESQVLDFQKLPNVTIIGSTTSGADGNVVYFYLPGNISVHMTGMGIYYPDGSNLQRAGVKIDEIVKPTIAGIKAGRDELLERAVEIINNENNK